MAVPNFPSEGTFLPFQKIFSQKKPSFKNTNLRFSLDCMFPSDGALKESVVHDMKKLTTINLRRAATTTTFVISEFNFNVQISHFCVTF